MGSVKWFYILPLVPVFFVGVNDVVVVDDDEDVVVVVCGAVFTSL